MRKRFILSLVVLACLMAVLPTAASALTSTSTGTEKWYWQNPIPQGNTLGEVQFVDQNVGWAAGVRGTLLKTGDGGKTWTGVFTGSKANITALCPIDLQKCYVGTSDGQILYTADAGGSWQSGGAVLAPPGVVGWQYSEITDISYVDGTLWATAISRNLADAAIGGVIYRRSGDWAARLSTGYNLNAIAMANKDVGWAVGDAGRVITINLTAVSPALYYLEADFSGDDFWDVACIPGNTRLVTVCGGSGRVVYSVDGGGPFTTDWIQEVHGAPAITRWRSVTLSSDGANIRGWYCGDAGVLAYTTDEGASGGLTFTSKTSGTNSNLLAAASVGGTRGWAVGSDGAVVRSDPTDVTGNWLIASSDVISTRANLWHVDFANALEGYACGDNGTIVHTADGGRNWEKQESGLDVQTDRTTRANLNSVFVNPADPGEAWAVGDSQWITVGGVTGWHWTILHTTDHGVTWLPMDSTNSVICDLQDVWFNSSGLGWACGGSGPSAEHPGGTVGQFLKFDGSWTAPFPAGYGAGFTRFNAIWMNGADGWLVGTSPGVGGGFICKTSAAWEDIAGDLSPSLIAYGGVNELLDVTFRNGSTGGFAVGTGGTVLTSANGTTWDPFSLGVGTFGLTSVTFANNSYGWMGGLTPTIDAWSALNTVNGGGNWGTTDPGADLTRAVWCFDSVMDGSQAKTWGVGLRGTIVSNFDIPIVPPDPPSAFTAAAAGTDKIDLDWQAPSGASQVKIFRSLSAVPFPVPYDGTTTPAGWELVGPAGFPVGTTAFQDTGLAGDTMYYYAAFAGDADDLWSGAAIANAKTTPVPVDVAPVTNLTVVAGAADGSALLTWTNPGAPFFQAKVLRKSGTVGSTDPSDGTQVYLGPLGTTTDSGLMNGSTYAYTVFAGDDASPTVNWSTGVTKTFTVGTSVRMPVWRFRNKKLAGTYLWTASATERNNINATMSSTWQEEGEAFSINTANPLNKDPLWRFLKTTTWTYFFTATEAEKNSTIANLSSMWGYEGVAFSICLTPQTTTIWRFRNASTNTFLFTGDVEKDLVLANNPEFALEGPAFWIAP